MGCCCSTGGVQAQGAQSTSIASPPNTRQGLASCPFAVSVSLCLCVSVSLCLCVSVSLCLCVSVPLCLCVSVPLCLCVSVSLDRMFLLPSDRIFLLLASQIGSQTPAQLRPTSSSQPNAPQKQVTKSQILSKRQEVCLQALHCIHSQSSLLCHSVDPSLPAPFPPLLLFPPPLLLLLLFFSLFFSFFHLWPPFSFGKQHPHMVGERRCGRRSRLPVRLMTWPW